MGQQDQHRTKDTTKQAVGSCIRHTRKLNGRVSTEAIVDKIFVLAPTRKIENLILALSVANIHFASAFIGIRP